MAIKIELNNKIIKLPLNISQGGIRIADEHGNHVGSPTKTINRSGYFIEWMITNDENQILVENFFESRNDIEDLIRQMKQIERFAENSKYSKRETIKVEREDWDSGISIRCEFTKKGKEGSFTYDLEGGERGINTVDDYDIKDDDDIYDDIHDWVQENIDWRTIIKWGDMEII